MKTSTLLKVWIVLTLGWLLLLGPSMAEWRRQEDPTGMEGRALWWSVGLIGLSLASALVLHVLYRRGARRHSGEVDGGLVIDVSPTRALPGMAQGVAAVGVTLLLAQIPSPACGGIVLSLLLTAFGAFLLRRETLRIESGPRVIRGTHVLGRPLGSSEIVLPEQMPLRLEIVGPQGGLSLLVGPVTLAAGLEHSEALRIAGEVGRGLRREVRDNTAHAPGPSLLVRGMGALARLPGFALLVILLGMGAAWMIPAGRSALCRLAVAPHTPLSSDVRIPALRVAAARYLAADPTDENLLTLLRVVNTADPARSPEILEAAVAELQDLAGGEMAVAEGDAIGPINRWAARRLGRPLDAHDGVMDWYRVENEKYRSALDAMAGDDLDAAVLAWDSFGAGDLTNPEDFLWAAGPALADRRPIHFVLRTDNGLEARPERREAYAGPVLAETVGEAVALLLGGYDGVGSPKFFEGFWDWWAGYARVHHLPPGGPAAR